MRARQVSVLKLRMLRIDQGLSQTALAEKTGVAHNTIGRIENGELPSAATAYKIASFFGEKPSELWPELLADRNSSVTKEAP